MNTICEVCGFKATTTQGLAGHRRLSHMNPQARAVDPIPEIVEHNAVKAVDARIDLMENAVALLKTQSEAFEDFMCRIQTATQESGGLEGFLSELQNGTNAVLESTGSLKAELASRLEHIEAQVESLRGVLNDRDSRQGLRQEALQSQLDEANELGRLGASALSNVMALVRYMKEDLLPAIVAHDHEQAVVIYLEGEGIERLPKCSYCGGLRSAGSRTCGRLACAAKVLHNPENSSGRE